MQQRFYFCPKCGGKLAYFLRNQIKRLTCEKCRFVMYENPVVGVAGILMNKGRILLGRRSQAATYPGLWCIPCGYVEYDEEVRVALKREFFEETGLFIEVQDVFAVLSNFHNPECHTVGIWFLVAKTGGNLAAGDDLDQVEFFALDDIPPLAFPTDSEVIAMLKRE